MSKDFKPVLYLKQQCPFCLKIRIFLLETGLADTVSVRDFVTGTHEEEVTRAELASHLARISFPAAEIEPGRFISDSDEIVAILADRAGRRISDLAVYRNYVDGPLATLAALFKENRELKSASVPSA